ncbi:TetR/AcrR family transcriptional regulator [Paenibacillus sp. R14(2021)]|uniref:TetR/AcrR family transcriptional regulator n=1 Tax=Paenibacillus sp. R14(2021) TaxID=2859228 RepID=UPI001C611D46|nr:TetR/AcrR family transcriptional regulator [Paenibacillus sp. R14(2021)]
MSKRQDILEATLDLIDEEGLQSVTFAKIMKRANVGSGTIFNYFSNKEDLVNELYRDCRRLLGDHLMMGYDPEQNLYERFKYLQRNRLKFAVEFPKQFRFIDAYSYSPCIKPEMRNLDDDAASREAVLAIITEGQKLGIIREMDPKLCHSISHGIVTAIVKGFHVNKFPLTDQQIQQTMEASWKAILV